MRTPVAIVAGLLSLTACAAGGSTVDTDSTEGVVSGECVPQVAFDGQSYRGIVNTTEVERELGDGRLAPCMDTGDSESSRAAVTTVKVFAIEGFSSTDVIGIEQGDRYLILRSQESSIPESTLLKSFKQQ